MPNRLIKSSIHESEKVNALSDFQFRVWVSLITYVDDFGRGDARPAIIKGNCFPLRKRITENDIEAALQILADTGCIGLYEVDGRPYLYFPNWESHQTIRNKRSKFPEPTLANNCEQLHANVPVIQSESNPNPNPNPKRRREDLDESFDRFWKAYPRKDSKKEARQKWNRLAPDPELTERIIADIARKKQTEQWQKAGGKYIPMPSTYLNQERWEDEGADIPAQNHGYEEHRLSDDEMKHLLINLDD